MPVRPFNSAVSHQFRIFQYLASGSLCQGRITHLGLMCNSFRRKDINNPSSPGSLEWLLLCTAISSGKCCFYLRPRHGLPECNTLLDPLNPLACAIERRAGKAACESAKQCLPKEGFQAEPSPLALGLIGCLGCVVPVALCSAVAKAECERTGAPAPSPGIAHEMLQISPNSYQNRR